MKAREMRWPLWVAQNALILSPNFTDSNVNSGGPDNMSRGYGKFLGLSQPPEPLYRKYSAVGRTVRKQETVFSDTISRHTAALRGSTAHRRRSSAPQMTVNGPEYFLSC